MRNRTYHFLCRFAVLFIFAAGEAGAQQPGGDAPAGSDSDLPDLKDATISVPWNELRDLLTKSGGRDKEPAPVDYVFSEATYTVMLDERQANAVARVEVTTLAAGWTLVPLGPADSGVVSANVQGKLCRLVIRDKSLYALFERPGTYALEVQVQRPIEKTPAGRQFSLALLPAALVTLQVGVPDASILISADAAAAARFDEKDGKTFWTAVCRGGQTMPIVLQQAPPPDRSPRIYANTNYLVTADDGLVRVTAEAELDIAHAPVRELRVGLDKRAIVLDVTGTHVTGFSAEQDEAAQPIVVSLSQAVTGKLALRIIYELDTADDTGVEITTLQIPSIRREQGVIAVAAAEAVEIARVDTQVPRMSVSRLPAALRELPGPAPQLAFRYATRPARLGLHVRRRQPQPARLRAQTETLVSVGAAALTCRAQITYEVRHAGVDTLRIGLPKEAEVRSVNAAGLRQTTILAAEANAKTLVLDMKDLVENDYEFTVVYTVDIRPDDERIAVPLLTHPDATEDRGNVGVEVRASWDLEPAAENLERIDVKELPAALWGSAVSPILLGYRYDEQPAELSLGLTRHEDLDVLVAMSDICEASTVVTPDGKCITKMMFIARNNLKPFMKLDLPEGAQLWSALVDDRPVTPARNGQGQVMIPLKKSDEVDEDDDDSYRARRERRRSHRPGEARVLRDRLERLESIEENGGVRDLKPYDVELVFVSPPVELDERGSIEVSLPRCDVPTGQMAWAVFLPSHLRVVDAEGNLREVDSFSLPFRHFGEAAYLRQMAAQAQEVEQLAQAQEQLQEMAKQLADVAQAAKAEGVLPVRIEIPITGGIHRFEKFLVVDEAPKMTLLYRRKLD